LHLSAQLRAETCASKGQARKAANAANSKIRSANPELYKGMEIHEIHPVKFGGSPTDLSNKIAIPIDVHRKLVTPWWNKLGKLITKI
jgi:filamentous hemagglutinin